MVVSAFQYETVSSTVDDNGVRTIALNPPDSLNAMNRRLIDEVAVAFDDANGDPATRAIVFTGAGRAIVFGGKPVVGAINGWAVGGGFEWAINCDFPIWAESRLQAGPPFRGQAKAPAKTGLCNVIT